MSGKLTRRYQGGGQNKLQTGNRVYNGGSPSPHAGGGLDKSGYLKRDQQAKTQRNLLKQRLKKGGSF